MSFSKDNVPVLPVIREDTRQWGGEHWVCSSGYLNLHLTFIKHHVLMRLCLSKSFQSPYL